MEHKKTTSWFPLIGTGILLVILFANCSKTDIPVTKYRIKKMSDNLAMEHPWTFFYDADNRLIQYQDEDKILNIRYDKDSKPTKLTYFDSSTEETYSDITWNNDDFIVAVKNSITCSWKKDSKGRFVNLVIDYPEELFGIHSTSIFDMNWIGSDSLETIENKNNNHSAYKFNTINCPFNNSDINVIGILGPDFLSLFGFQNRHCIDKMNSNGTVYILDYVVNENNYPSRLGVGEGSYFYFEYESYETE